MTTYLSPEIETKHGRILRIKELVNVKEAAEIMGVSVRSVYTLVKRGELDRVKIGGSNRITTRSIRELLYGWEYDNEEPEKDQANPAPAVAVG